jgi:hypothetical protein
LARRRNWNRRQRSGKKLVKRVRGNLAVLMAPLQINAGRTITLALPRGANVMVVEARFRRSQLFGLTAMETDPDSYRAFVTRSIKRPDDGSLPDRVELSMEWRLRKLWEIGQYADKGELGGEVDESVLKQLAPPDEEPVHPALALDLEDVEPATMSELIADRRVDGFYHGSTIAALRTTWYELDEGKRETGIRPSVRSWADSWGYLRIAELMLDLASFYAAIDQKAVARAFRDLLVEEDRKARIDSFLIAYALAQLSKAT